MVVTVDRVRVAGPLIEVRKPGSPEQLAVVESQQNWYLQVAYNKLSSVIYTTRGYL